METKIQKIKENLNTLDDKIKQPRLTMQENIQKWKKICILKLVIFVRKLWKWYQNERTSENPFIQENDFKC